MNIGRASEYKNTPQLFIGVNLFKMCVLRGGVECRSSNGGADWSGVWGGGTPSPVGCGVWAPEKNVSILSFKMLNFHAFWTLEHGDSNRNTCCNS